MAKLTKNDCIGERSPGRLIRKLNRLLQTRIESRFTDDQLSYSDWMALKLVRDGVASTAGDLARDLGINPGATTRLIDALENQGLLERDHSSPDRRVVLLKLTKAGEIKHNEKIPNMVSSWNEILEGFEQAEAIQLIDLMAKLVDSMEQVIARAPAS